MKQIYFLVILFLTMQSAYSQSQQKAIGIRGGISSGIEYRVYTSELSSYKALLSTRKRGIQLTGMKEFHVPQAFDFSEDFTLVYGFGAHAGFESWYVDYYYDVNFPNDWRRERRFGPIAGLDALAAIEYTVPQIPLIVGIEAKSYFNMFGRDFFQLQPFDFAFTVKYTF